MCEYSLLEYGMEWNRFNQFVCQAMESFIVVKSQKKYGQIMRTSDGKYADLWQKSIQ